MANPFFYEETTKDRLFSLAKWYITPGYLGVAESSNIRVVALKEHVEAIVLELKESKAATQTWCQKTRYVSDVFIKCSYIYCENIKQDFRDVNDVLKHKCCPFVEKSSPSGEDSPSITPGFLFFLHNHQTIETLPAQVNKESKPQSSRIPSETDIRQKGSLSSC